MKKLRRFYLPKTNWLWSLHFRPNAQESGQTNQIKEKSFQFWGLLLQGDESISYFSFHQFLENCAIDHLECCRLVDLTATNWPQKEPIAPGKTSRRFRVILLTPQGNRGQQKTPDIIRILFQALLEPIGERSFDLSNLYCKNQKLNRTNPKGILLFTSKCYSGFFFIE